MISEAKAKLAKGDKKGASGSCSFVCTVLRSEWVVSYTCMLFVLFPGALFAMKRKKLYEQEIDKIENVKMTLETQVINLESAAQNAQTFKAMDAGAKTMKKIRTDIGIEQVDDMMDAIKEEMEMANEINEAIAQPVDPLLADDDELLAELNALETSDLEAELLRPTPALSMPTVPNAKLPKLANKEEEELKMLEAELAGL